MCHELIARETGCRTNALKDTSPINEFRPTIQEAAPGALADAASELRKSVCPNGPAAGSSEDFDRPETEWRILQEWAQQRGLILPASFPPPERDGGREHDVRYDAECGLWWKYTKANLCGYTVSWSSDTPYMHNALPSEYLERMLRLNALFGDDIRLVGLWNPGSYDWRIVTTQPHVTGEAATLDQLSAAFERVGFEILPWRDIGYSGSLAARKDGIDVWDIHPANVLISEDGLPVPFDVMLTCCPE